MHLRIVALLSIDADTLHRAWESKSIFTFIQLCRAISVVLTVGIVGAVIVGPVIGESGRWRGGSLASGQTQAQMFGDFGMILMVHIVEDTAAGHFDLENIASDSFGNEV